MELKLEITKTLEKLAEQGRLDNSIAILNLPAMFLCEKMCSGCYFTDQEANHNRRLGVDKINQVIDYFQESYDIKFITINGRGDPFHPSLVEETLGKIAYASLLGIKSYVFTAGDNLNDDAIATLVEREANVMISLFGNKFIDAGFFEGKGYRGEQKVITDNLRALIEAYRTNGVLNSWYDVVSEEGISSERVTRIGMNYVVSEKDLEDETRIKELKQAVNEAGMFFVVNVDFKSNNQRLQEIVNKYSNFQIPHSTAINGICRMGAASSATVDYDGTIYKCPYMTKDGEGNFFERLRDGTLANVLNNFARNEGYSCVLRNKCE